MQMQHTPGEDQLTLKISSTINAAPINISWVVKDFYIFYAACLPNCGMCTWPLPKDCTKCLNNWIMQNGNCTPPENFILFESSFWENTFTILEGWVLINNDPGNLIYQCNSKTLVGGFKSLGQGASATLTKNNGINIFIYIEDYKRFILKILNESKQDSIIQISQKLIKIQIHIFIC